MKTLSLLLLSLSMMIASAFAGINGTYDIKGSEVNGKDKLTYYGTLTLKNGRNYVIKVHFNDGYSGVIRGKFPKAFGEDTELQTITFSPKIDGTKTNGTVTLKGTRSGYKLGLRIKKGSYLLSGKGNKGL